MIKFEFLIAGCTLFFLVRPSGCRAKLTRTSTNPCQRQRQTIHAGTVRFTRNLFLEPDPKNPGQLYSWGIEYMFCEFGEWNGELSFFFPKR